MAAVPINLTIESGADWATSFNLRDENGNYIPLYNYAISAKMARNYSKNANKINLNAIINTASEGEIKLSLTALQTSQLKFGRYVYDVIITAPFSSGGRKDKVIEGIITVQEGVTIL